MSVTDILVNSGLRGLSSNLRLQIGVTNPYLYFKLYYNSGTEFGFAGECKSSLPFEFPTRTMVLFCINYDKVNGYLVRY